MSNRNIVYIDLQLRYGKNNDFSHTPQILTMNSQLDHLERENKKSGRTLTEVRMNSDCQRYTMDKKKITS